MSSNHSPQQLQSHVFFNAASSQRIKEIFEQCFCNNIFKTEECGNDECVFLDVKLPGVVCKNAVAFCYVPEGESFL